MLSTITLTLSTLILINFILLKFSCNKTLKPTKKVEKPVIFRPEITIAPVSQMLAPTGS